MYSPIALFIYKRPEHTHKVLQSLMQCPEFIDSPLYIFCDAAKKQEDIDKVLQTRKMVRELVGDKAEMIEAETNKGLANSIIEGVTYLCDKYGRAIVIEDDLVVSPRTLGFFNLALEKYQNEPTVMQISGYMFPISEFADRKEALFLPYTTSWGWATWKRAWDCFDSNASGWQILETEEYLRRKFNLDNSYDYFQMLQQQLAGDIDSWAILWYWSVFKKSGYVLYPPKSYINNIGFDGTGTHGSFFVQNKLKQQDLLDLSPLTLPTDILVYDEHLIKANHFFKRHHKSWIFVIKNKLKKYLNFR